MSLKKETSLTFHLPNFESKLRIPYVKEGVSAGFPSPATDFLGNEIDLNKERLKSILREVYTEALTVEA